MLYAFLFSLAVLLLRPASLFAEPTILSDPYAITELQPTKFVLVLDGIARDVLPEKYPDGTSRLNYQLTQIADGVHTVRVKAVNAPHKLESAEVSFSFRKSGQELTRIKDESDKRPPSRTFKGYLKDEQ